jgi:hypothetical protein
MYVTQLTEMKMTFKFSQINLDNCKAATLLLENSLSENDIDIVVAQDIYCAKDPVSKAFLPPEFDGYQSNYVIDESNLIFPKAVIYIKYIINSTLISQCSMLKFTLYYMLYSY